MPRYCANNPLLGKFHGKDTRIDKVKFQKQIVGKWSEPDWLTARHYGRCCEAELSGTFHNQYQLAVGWRRGRGIGIALCWNEMWGGLQTVKSRSSVVSTGWLSAWTYRDYRKNGNKIYDRRNSRPLKRWRYLCFGRDAKYNYEGRQSHKRKRYWWVPYRHFVWQIVTEHTR